MDDRESSLFLSPAFRISPLNPLAPFIPARTQWQALEENTTAPYTLTLKSNGCIIFIAALTPAQLLVTSKHSLGPAPGASGAESHAQVGERWLRAHLARAGKTEAELARTLWDNNWTAVAEVRSFFSVLLGIPYTAARLNCTHPHSCAMTASKSMYSPTGPRRLGCTYTV